MPLTSPELFAARGDEWNRPNYQFHVDSYYRRRHPDGTLEVVDRRLIDGYDLVPKPHVRPRFRPDPAPRGCDKSGHIVVSQLKRLKERFRNAS